MNDTNLSTGTVMRTLLTLLCLTVLGSTISLAQPKMEVQDTVDWGVVVPDAPPGEPAKVRAAVSVRNIGTEVLKITEVRPGCGCTTAPIERDSLGPGEETVIDVTLNLPLANGPITKSVTITSNDPERSTRALYLVADVQRPLQLSSSFIPFNKGAVGDTIQGALTFSVQGERPITVKARADQSDVVILSPIPLVMQPGGDTSLKVGFIAKRPGPFTVKVHFETDQNGYESFDLTGYGVADPAPADSGNR